MYIVYICEYNQWSIVSGIERAPVALSRSVHDEKALFEKKMHVCGTQGIP